MVEVILPQLPRTFDSIVDPEGRAALIWILGEYGEVSTGDSSNLWTSSSHGWSMYVQNSLVEIMY